MRKPKSFEEVTLIESARARILILGPTEAMPLASGPCSPGLPRWPCRLPLRCSWLEEGSFNSCPRTGDCALLLSSLWMQGKALRTHGLDSSVAEVVVPVSPPILWPQIFPHLGGEA